MVFRFVAILACVGAALCEEYKPAYGKSAANYDYAPAKYSFDWAVKDDPSYNDFSQQESRDGDKTSGSYRVLLPDGRVQTVTYSVDAYSGYNADVQYSGEAKYDYKPAYKAAYPAPAPAYPTPAYKPAYTTPAYKPSYSTPAYPEYKPSYSTPAYPEYKPSYSTPAYPEYKQASYPAPAYQAYKPSYPAPAYPAYRPAYPAPAYPAYRPEYQRYPTTTVVPTTEAKAEEAPVTEAVVAAEETEAVAQA